MKNLAFIFLLTFVALQVFSQPAFLTDQKRYKRVRDAFSEKESFVKNTLKVSDICY